MDTMLMARTRRKITTEEMARMTGINVAVVSQVERGVGVPTRKQRILLLNALGPITFEAEKEEYHMAAPEMPICRWNPDGSPDFNALESDQVDSEEKMKDAFEIAQKRIEDGQGVPSMATGEYRNGRFVINGEDER